MSERILYQFPISHYCEKTRWNLDAKGLTYEVVNLVPGVHRATTMRLAKTRTLPILVDGGKAIADSTEIAHYLDKKHPSASVIPADEKLRARVLELEQAFDRVGNYVRRWMYGLIIDQPDIIKVMFRPYSLPVKIIGRTSAPLLRMGLKNLYKINPAAVEKAKQETLAGLDLLEKTIDGRPDRYLAGNQFTLADITAASMLAPILSPKGTPWEDLGDIPEAALQIRREIAARPAGRWVMERYRKERWLSL